MKNLYIFCKGILLVTALFIASELKAQTTTYTDGPLTVEVFQSNPCDGSANGFIQFKVISTSDGTPASLNLIFGPVNLLVPKSIPVGGTYIHNPAKNLPQPPTAPPGYEFAIVDPNGTNVASSFGSPLMMYSFPNIVAADDASVNLVNSSCTTPDGQIAINLSGGSMSIGPGQGLFNYKWTTTNSLPGFDVVGTYDGTGTLDLATLLGISGLPGGKYDLTVSDSLSQCFVTRTWTITDPQPGLQVVTNAGNQTVCASDVAVLQLGGSEIGVNYEILVNGTPSGVILPGTGGPLVFNVPAGTFSNGQVLIVEASFGSCSPRLMTGSIVMIVNPLPTISGVSITPICEGITSTNLIYSLTTGSPSQYSIDFDATAEGQGFADVVNAVLPASPISIAVPGGAVAGSYNGNLTVRNTTTGCVSLVVPISVTINPLPTAVISGGGPVCTGDPLPDVIFTFTGTAPFNFTYTDGVNPPVNVVGHATTTFTIPTATAGNYSITALTDANACGATSLGTPVVVTVNPLPTASTSGGGTICAGDVLPDVTFTFTGTAPFDFTYTDGVTPVNVVGHATPTFTITNAPAGSYIVTALTDANTCAATDFGTATDVIVNPLPTAVGSGGGAVCTGDVLPDVTFTFTGTAPFDFTYADGINPPVNVVGHATNTFTVTTASAGNYIVTALTDANTCAATDLGVAVAVTVNPLPTASTSGGGTICAGDVLPDVTFTFTGTAPFDFTYTDGVTPVNVVGHATTSFTITNAPAGSYIVTALTDANTCAATDFGTATDVIVNPLPTASISGGGPVCASDPLPDVTFTFTGTAPFDFTYTDGINPPVNVVGHATTTFTIPTAPAGNYSITTLTDASTCPATSLGTPVAVTVNPLPTASTSGGGTICAGDVLPDVTFTFTGTAPFDFTYTDGVTPVNVVGHATTTFTIANAPAGSYIVTALTDANTCSATDFGTASDVIVNPLPTASISGGGPVCASDPLPDVTFTFTGTAPFDFTYTDGINPPVNVVGHATTTFTIPTAPAGNYSITTLTDASTCPATSLGTPAAVTVNPLPTASTSGGGTICAGDVLPDVTFTFTGTAPFDFTYTDGVTPVNVVGHATTTFTITNAPAGSYIVTALTDANTCSATDFGTASDVIVNPLPTASISGGGPVCASDPLPDVTFTFTGTAPFDFTYTDGINPPVNVVGHATTTFTIPTAAVGNYSITVLTDASTCPANSLGTPVAVTVNPLPTASTSGGGTICAGDVLPDVTFTFTGTAPFDFTYTDGTTPVNVVGHATSTFTITNAPAGSYIVTALTDANTCAATDFGTATDVIVDPLPTATISGGGTICAGDPLPTITFTFTGAGPFDFTYTDGVNPPVSIVGHPVNTFSIVNAPEGNYSVTALSGANSCTGIDLGTPVAVVVTPILGDPTVYGTDTWLGYVYTDAANPAPPVTNVDFDITKYRGFIEATDIDAMTAASSYDAPSDQFDLNLNASPVSGPNVCGTYANDFSIRYRMQKTLGEGVYNFTLGSDDGARLFIDGINVIDAYTVHSYATFTSGPLCLSAGTHDFVIEYFERGGQSRLSFAYTQAPTPSVITPIALCVGSPTPTLTASTADVNAIDFNWYTDAGLTNLIFTGSNYTPAITELDMSVAGSTSFFVTSTYACGETAASTVVVDVLDNATINIPTNPITVCEGVGNVDLTTLVTATPPGGTFVFAGTNVTGDLFDPAGLAGTSVAITVDYSTGSCIAASVILNIDVTDVATLTLPIADVPVCESGGIVDLLAFVSAVPTGGTFTFGGTGVTGTNFDPSGLNGIQAITVSYDASGCVGNGIFNIDVVPNVTVSVTDSDVCETGGIVSLLGFVSGVPAGGTFTFTGAGVTGTDFDPLGLAGPQNISVDYVIGGCADNATLVLNVINTTPPAVVSPVTLCVNSAAPVLTASNGDAGVIDFNWYTDAALTNLIFTGANYTPAAPELDMTVVASTSFFVTTVYGCGESTPATVIVDIVNGATITIPATPIDVCESGGTIDLTTLVSGLPAAGTFTFTGTNVTGNNFDPTGLTGTTVSILVDYTSGGCVATTATLDINVIDIAAINFPATPPQACETGGIIDLSTYVTGNPAGGTFTFSGTQVTGSDFDPTGLSGLQTITVDYNVGGCLANGTFDIDVVTIATLTINDGFTCQNGPSIDLLTRVSGSPSGGNFTFAGSGVTGSAFNPAGLLGSINIAVTYDIGGCLASGTLVMTVLDPSDPLCSGGGVNCNVFTVTVSDARPSCANQDDGSISFTVAGGTPNYIVTLTNTLGFAQALPGPGPNFTFNNLSPADYSYTIQDALGNTCTLPYSLPIQTTVVATADPASFVDAVCFGDPTGIAIINASGSQTGEYFYSIDGVTWTLFTPGNPITDLPPNGTYNVLVGESIGDACRASVPVTINSQNPDMVVTYSVTNATCNNNDGSITVNPPTGGGGGPYEFAISNGANTTPFQASATFTNLAGGIYSLLVKDAIGCIKTINPVNVTFPGFVNFTTLVNNADCTNNGNSGSISITVTDIGSTYLVALSQDQFNEPDDTAYQNYVSPSVMFTSLPRGVYYLYVKSVTAACPTRSAPIIIQGSYAITFDIVPICTDNKLSISLSNITGEPNVPFEIRVFKKFTSIVIETIPVATIPPTGSYLIDYDGVNVERNWIRTPGEYQIQIAQVQSTFCLLESPLTDYRVEPSLSAAVLSTFESYPDIFTGSMTVGNIVGGAIDYEIRIELDSAAVIGQNFQTNWEIVGQNPNLKYEKVYNKIPAGRYKVEIMDANTCVLELVGRVPLDTDLYVPNIFTPNGDGFNDTFFIRNLPITGGTQIVISNRWGKDIFSSKDYQNNWDGGDVADGVYYYKLNTQDGTTLKGWVEILRGKKP